MRTFAIATIFILATSQAFAVERLRSDRLECATLQQRIATSGTVIVRYPSSRVDGLILFDRYVSGDSQCPRDLEAVKTSVPSADAKQCAVFRCEEVEPPLKPLFGD